jgi:tetratricopeptide (TPR) repeat protein
LKLDDLETTLVSELNGYISQNDDGSYDVKYDEAIKYLDSAETDSDIEKSLTDYYKFIMAYYADKDDDVMLGFLDSAYTEAGEYSYLYSPLYLSMAWEYKSYDKVLSLANEAIEFNLNDASAYYYAVKVYIEQDDLDTADEMCEKLRESNPDGLDYYSTKAELLRRRNKLEESVEICRQGIVAGSDAEIYRQQAISYMLLSDKDNALEAITQSYELAMQNTTSGISLEEINTVALICFLCGDTDTYDEIVSMLEEYDYSLYDKVQNCIKGDITFENIFMEGSGEIS